MAEFGKFDLTGRIEQQKIFAGQPFEPRANVREVLMLSAERKRFVFLTAEVIQMTLIPFDDGFGDIARASDATVQAPASEAADGLTPFGSVWSE